MYSRLLLFWLGLLACTSLFSATYDFSYSGRLIDSTGKPYDGPVALKASFYHADTGSSPILEVTSGLTQVPLSEGVFQIKLSLSDSDFQRAFPGVSQNVYIQITDLTNSPNQPYDRQQLTILPYAGKIPIDTSQFSWDSLGQLRFTASSTADFTSAGPIGTTTPNSAIFTTVTTNRTSSATSGSVVNVTISPTYNQASGTAANTDLLINRTETAVGSGTQRLIDAQVGGTTMFNVSNAGNGYFAGNVGIGTTGPTEKLSVLGNMLVNDYLKFTGSPNWTTVPASIRYAGGHLYINGGSNSTTLTNAVGTSVFSISGISGHFVSDAGTGGMTYFSQADNSADGFDQHFRKARGTNAVPTVINTADELGTINFTGYGGASGYIAGAAIKGTSSGTIADSRVPGELSFWTGTNAAPSVLTQRVTINNSGNVGIGTTSPTYKLDVNGNTRVTGGAGTAAGLTALSVTDNSSATFRLSFDNAGVIQFSGKVLAKWGKLGSCES